MEVVARQRSIRCSAQKARLVGNLIRGKTVEQGLDVLLYSPKQIAQVIRKTLISSVSNAEENHGLDIDDLVISKVMIDEGPVLKRWRARAKGRAARILKQTCHISIFVSDSAQ